MLNALSSSPLYYILPQIPRLQTKRVGVNRSALFVCYLFRLIFIYHSDIICLYSYKNDADNVSLSGGMICQKEEKEKHLE